ncbi:pyridoxamine 5'-phosphate oxidase family protein [Streptomyces sp. MST-110588]|uniref:pyridoxamine 5'-phosphate oxidase family protein n=1 Tax=Streptomyces sp. MST-110588 TaxID=2833628 RepID=UPI001F5DFADC|nr:pyridoxamine 5'-phosphate oxidase family protein [Streptomyces sp. MST-110588]UNO40752.1 pyridoxamine 5'-phosphate oxidase family protein [Streptomyces sp. MST-110588]
MTLPSPPSAPPSGPQSGPPSAPPAGFPPPRTPAARRADVERMLTEENHLWLATAGPDGPHLVPLAFAWDGTFLHMMTKRGSRTVTNLRRTPRARASLGSTRDVVLVDGEVECVEPGEAAPEVRALFARLPLNPERVPGVIALRLRPERVLAWRHMGEMPGRTVMSGGRWVTGAA